ncbi:MAG: ATPase, T2SS/T4P/T4SS family [Myxococcota bacterium]
MVSQTLSRKRPTTLTLAVVLGSGLSALLLALVLNATSVLTISGIALLYPVVLAMLGSGLLVALAMPALSGLHVPMPALSSSEATVGKAHHLVNSTLLQAMHANAQVVTLIPDGQELHIHFEVDGDLRDSQTASAELQPDVAARLKQMANLDVAQTAQPQQGQLRLKSQGQAVSIQVATVPTSFGEQLVLRLDGFV